MGCAGSVSNKQKIDQIIERSKIEVDVANQRICEYDNQIQDYEQQVENLKYSNSKGKIWYGDSTAKPDDRNYRSERDYRDRRDESGVDLSGSSVEDQEQAQESQNNKDYINIKIKGLEDEIKRLKAMQVVEQTNINEIQSKVNRIKMDRNLKEALLLKKELNKQERNITTNRA